MRTYTSVDEMLADARAADPPGARLLELADCYVEVQNLHAGPDIATQRMLYADVVEHMPPLAAGSRFFAARFREWARAYSYLGRTAVRTVREARAIAEVYHRGQVDKSGRPYILHPRAVARKVALARGTRAQRMAAMLHDVVEDTPATLDGLRELGVPEEVVVLVDALTHRDGEEQAAYLTRVLRTPGAVAVKRADIAHNTSRARLARLDRAERERLRAKYARALALLADAA